MLVDITQPKMASGQIPSKLKNKANRALKVNNGGAMKLGHSETGMLRPCIEAMFDCPRHTSFFAIGQNALSSPK